MSHRQLSALLTLLRRYGVSSYTTPDLTVSFDTSASVQPTARAMNGGPGDEIEDEPEPKAVDPRFALEQFYRDNGGVA